MKIGSLFSGYGGLDSAVEAVTGAETVWHSDIDPGACKILAHHWPDRRNLGDISDIEWSTVAPVDIITGGFPCQDVSMAGRRAGMKPGTRSGLWQVMAKAIDVLRPALVVAENVRGLLSADAHSDVEPCPWCVGDPGDEPPLRALGAVLGDLADIGYDAAWHGLTAASVGAPHGRFRVFIVAWPAGDFLAQDADRATRSERRVAAPGQASGGRARADAGGSDRAGTTGAQRTSAQRSDRDGSTAADPPFVPSVARGPESAGIIRGSDAAQRGDAVADAHGRGREVGTELDSEPPQDPADRRAPRQHFDGHLHPGSAISWGQFEPAIRRWERLTRPAPAPTELSAKGNQRLSPAFVEWMMGLPLGHVTDVPGLTRNEQLKALGNGVVPQQAEAALEILFNAVAVAA